MYKHTFLHAPPFITYRAWLSQAGSAGILPAPYSAPLLCIASVKLRSQTCSFSLWPFFVFFVSLW
jgi:hypothetical protein